MVRHNEYAGIVLVRCGAIEDALAEEHGQGRWLLQLIDDARAALEALILWILVGVEVQQKVWDGVGILGSRQYLTSRLLWLLILLLRMRRGCTWYRIRDGCWLCSLGSRCWL